MFWRTLKGGERMSKRLACSSVGIYSENITICKDETPSDLWYLANKQIVGLS